MKLFKVTLGYRPNGDEQAMECYVQHTSISTVETIYEFLIRETDFYVTSVREVDFDTFEPIEKK